MARNRFMTLFFVSLFMIVGMAQAASAALLATFKKYTYMVFLDFPAALQMGTDGGIVGARILLMFLVFAIFFGISQLALKNYAKNIRAVITIILAIIASFAIPRQLVQEIFLVWGGVLYAFLVLVPVVGGTWLLYKVLKGETRFDYLIKLLISMLLVYITLFLSGVMFLSRTARGAATGALGAGGGSIPSAISVTPLSTFWVGLITFFNILGVFYVILMVYYIFKVIFPGESEGAVRGRGARHRDEEMPDNVKKALKRWWGTRGRPEFTTIPHTLDQVASAIRDKDEGKVKSALRRMHTFEDRVAKLVAWSQSQTDTLTGATKTTADGVIAEITAAHTAISGELGKIETELAKDTIGTSEWTVMSRAAREAIKNQRIVQSKALRLKGIYSA